MAADASGYTCGGTPGTGAGFRIARLTGHFKLTVISTAGVTVREWDEPAGAAVSPGDKPR
jgi:hypothetical protein